MGLVVLSVFALAFAACGDSDSGEPSGPSVPGGVQGPVPTSISIEEMPLEAREGAVHEGQVIPLAGIKLNVRDGNNKLEQVTDFTKMSIDPSIYIYTPIPGSPNSGTVYTLTYSSGGRSITTTLTIPNTKRLLNLAVTGQMAKQEYVIDDLPNYTGLTVNGVYAYAANVPGAVYPRDMPPNWENQSDYYRLPIELDISNPYYKWAWVHNLVPDSGSFINDRPGVLLAIGSYGHILSKIQGQGASLPPDDYLPPRGEGYTGVDRLTGTRVEITKLYQVREIKFNPEPNWSQIFYDDPRLISAVNSEDELTVRMSNWIDYALGSAKLNVTYEDGTNRDYTVKDLQTMGYAYADTYNNIGWGGTWANLEIFPLSQAGIRIDVTKDSKTVISADNDNGIYVKDFKWLDRDKDGWKPSYQEGQAVNIYGDGGWAQWAQLGTGRSELGFWWRGARVKIAVPIYNRPSTMNVTAKPGIPFNPVQMNGYDFVYRRPEGMTDFLRKVNISVTYVKQGGAANDTATRPDILADMEAGKCRTFIIGDPEDITRWNDNSTKFPSLYAEGIFNWKDLGAAEQNPANLYLYDVPAQLAMQRFSDATVSRESVIAGSMLNLDNSNNFANRQRTVRGRIYYRGWAGDATNTRPVNSGNQVTVGVIAYPENPPAAQ